MPAGCNQVTWWDFSNRSRHSGQRFFLGDKGHHGAASCNTQGPVGSSPAPCTHARPAPAPNEVAAVVPLPPRAFARTTRPQPRATIPSTSIWKSCSKRVGFATAALQRDGRRTTLTAPNGERRDRQVRVPTAASSAWVCNTERCLSRLLGAVFTFQRRSCRMPFADRQNVVIGQ